MTDVLALPLLSTPDLVVLPGMVVPVELDADTRPVLDAAQAGSDGRLLLAPRMADRYPTHGVVATVEPDHDQAGDRRGLERGQRVHWPCLAYVASTASFAGRHHSSCERYHSMVLDRPDSKFWNWGDQPSSWRSLPDSIA